MKTASSKRSDRKLSAQASALQSILCRGYSSALPSLEIELTAEEKYDSAVHTYGFSLYVNFNSDNMFLYHIWKILPDGPAEKAGLFQGDIIDEINGSDLALLSPDGVKDLIDGANGTINFKIYPHSTIRLFCSRPYTTRLAIKMPAQLLTVGRPIHLLNKSKPKSRGLDVVILWSQDIGTDMYAVLVIQQIYTCLNIKNKEYGKEMSIYPGDIIEMIDGMLIADLSPQFICNFLLDTSNRDYEIGHIAMSGARSYVRERIYRLDMEYRHVEFRSQMTQDVKKH